MAPITVGTNDRARYRQFLNRRKKVRAILETIMGLDFDETRMLLEKAIPAVVRKFRSVDAAEIPEGASVKLLMTRLFELLHPDEVVDALLFMNNYKYRRILSRWEKTWMEIDSKEYAEANRLPKTRGEGKAILGKIRRIMHLFWNEKKTLQQIRAEFRASRGWVYEILKQKKLWDRAGRRPKKPTDKLLKELAEMFEVQK